MGRVWGIDLGDGDRERSGERQGERGETEIEIGRVLVEHWLMCLMVSHCSCWSEWYLKTLLSPRIQVGGTGERRWIGQVNQVLLRTLNLLYHLMVIRSIMIH